VRRVSLLLAGLLCLILSGCYGKSRPPRIGSPAPDFTVQDSERKVTLSELRGKVVVLNFWASWCQPCIEETPSLVDMQHKLRDKGITVLSVNVDDDEDAYHRFLIAYHMDMLTVRDANKTSNALYGTFKFPETYVIDKDGVMQRKFIGAVDWSSPEVVEFLTRLSSGVS
jgi:cytochrome c biogenesis protein CcmG/thiol:disulfide interchange protein DsbE